MQNHDLTAQVGFWTRQGISLLAAVVLMLSLLLTRFDDPMLLAPSLASHRTASPSRLSGS